MPVTTSFFWKFYFSLRTSYKDMFWCTNNVDVHIHTFRKHWSFIWRWFFPVSILKMINRRLFIHKFCSNSKILLSLSWAAFVRVLVFSSSPRANSSSFEYLYFSFQLIFRFGLIRWSIKYWFILQSKKITFQTFFIAENVFTNLLRNKQSSLR